MAKTALPQPKEGVEQAGLFLAGDIVGRKRKKFDGKDGKPPRYVITITVNTGADIISAERWCDSPNPSDVPTMGERAVVPVRMVVFATKGGTRATLQWGESSGEESF